MAYAVFFSNWRLVLQLSQLTENNSYSYSGTQFAQLKIKCLSEDK